MNDLAQIGRKLFTTAVFALGIQALIGSVVIYELEPVPAWIHDQPVLANLTGLFLVILATGLLISSLMRLAALILAALLLLWVMLLHLPLLVPNPAPDLSFAFETLALAGVAWALAANAPPTIAFSPRWNTAIGGTAHWGRYAFAISLIAFCAVNFIYHRFISQMIPGWIPVHLFWAYFTGIASLAAGISILTGIWSRIALTLAGIMYSSWVLIIHIPYVATRLNAQGMWTDMFITLALAGGAWFLAGTIESQKTAAKGERHLLSKIFRKQLH